MSSATTKFQAACQKIGVSKEKCELLVEAMSNFCGGKGKTKKPRKLSRWNQCIKERRKGKPFDANAMKKLSVEYRAGKCP